MQTDTCTHIFYHGLLEYMDGELENHVRNVLAIYIFYHKLRPIEVFDLLFSSFESIFIWYMG